jgi:hypothetical protein
MNIYKNTLICWIAPTRTLSNNTTASYDTLKHYLTLFYKKAELIYFVILGEVQKMKNKRVEKQANK